MNFSRLLMAVILFFPLATQAQVPAAEIILNEACASAAKENKQVLLIFHASWCGWCHKMDNSLDDPACKKFFDDNYIICRLTVDESHDKKDLENPGAAQLKIKYGGEKEGLPYWLVFDKDKKMLASSKMPASPGVQGGNVGCPAETEEVAYFIDILRKTSRLGPEELAIISKRFRENK